MECFEIECFFLIFPSFSIHYDRADTEFGFGIYKDKITLKANSEEIEKEYLANTDSARKNKIFGSPSFIVNNEIFWGDDRMEDAINWSKK